MDLASCSRSRKVTPGSSLASGMGWPILGQNNAPSLTLLQIIQSRDRLNLFILVHGGNDRGGRRQRVTSSSYWLWIALVGQGKGRTEMREEKTWTFLSLSAPWGISLPSRNHWAVVAPGSAVVTAGTLQSLDSRSPLNKTPPQQLEDVSYCRRDQDKQKRVPFSSYETPVDLPLPASCPLTDLISRHCFPAVASAHTLIPSTGPGTWLPFVVIPARAFLLQESPAQRAFLGHFAGVRPPPATAHAHSFATLHYAALHDFSSQHLHSWHFMLIC